MDIHFDEAWCPVCDRQIMPKRYTVPVLPQTQELTPVPTSSPASSSPSKNQQSDSTARTSKTKSGAVRAKSGLLQGTGRVKPNGAIKKSDSTTAAANKGRASSPQPQQPVAPVKHRTIIDQGPIPLYCSDECRLQDLSRLDGAYPLNYHPDRSSPPLPRVPHNSFERRYCESEDESTSASGSSLDSGCSSSPPLVTVSRSMATLAALYDFPPLPPAPPMLSLVDTTSSSEIEYRNDYQGGTMMASKRIKEVLCPPRPKPSPFYSEPLQPKKVVPGWTDGGSEWRQSVYGGYSKHSDTASVGSQKVQTSFAASSHRGVQWTSTLSQSNSSSALAAQCPPSNLPPPRSSQSYSEELYAKYSLPLSRRSESRMSLFPHSASSSAHSPPLSPTSTSSSGRRRREVPLLKRGAEGRLLVPDVILTRNNSSMGTLSQRPAKPLRRHPSEVSGDSILSDTTSESLDSSSRPAPQTRTWSYDNIKTYPVMMPPTTKEKRIEQHMINGEVKEIEVEVVQPLKRLFLFPGKETIHGGRP
ncbi:uncharacterized protein EDB93DRAFT_1101727 [Suillus bovinus]|uniref:uncharacterized protein n=1 Tax=Suillus bovinus TaxID=48563 RepID=UPI001B881E44|nr:uncharacterized protein EDB93DRAFT_1101727 [Suillus bovinus]KAG2155967.1 hypothetical protein EDB93DRAFT_1101727 [Suillus bovinus]